MILKDLKIFSQNVQKNNFIINTILKVNYNFNIIFIQELSWTIIRSITSSENCEGISLIGIANHLSWLIFTRELDLANNYPRVIIYINIRLSPFHFVLQKDIIDYSNILLVLFFNNNKLFWIINVYSDFSHSALKYFKDIEANISNLLIMTGNFNIWDSLWDLSFPHHLTISDDLIIIADSFNLELSTLTNQVLTRYSDNSNDSNSVINLMFLWSRSSELNNHSIHPDWYLTSNYAPLTITISIVKENVNSSKHSITKNSKEEAAFIKDIITSIKGLDTSNLYDINRLENVINTFAYYIECAWEKNSKNINITRHSKSWWSEKCNKSLSVYRTSRKLEDWKIFQKTIKNTKHTFVMIDVSWRQHGEGQRVWWHDWLCHK